MTVATGVGSVPGVDPRESITWIADAVPQLPHVPELPERGPWADMVGRVAALLVDLPVEIEVGRWRATSRPGRDMRKARAFLDEDLDAVEEVLAGYEGAAKLQVCGPITFTSVVETGGGAAVGDAAALNDFAASLSEGVAQHVSDVQRRLPRVQWTVQVDEPALEAAVRGQIPTPSGYATLPPLPSTQAIQALRGVVDAAALAGRTVVHTCASSPPLDVLTSVGADALNLDLSVVDVEEHADDLVRFVDQGGDLWPGLSLAQGGESRRPLTLLRRLQSVLALSSEQFADRTVLTPSCGLAGQPLDVARAAYAAVEQLARRVTQGETTDSELAEGALSDGS